MSAKASMLILGTDEYMFSDCISEKNLITEYLKFHKLIKFHQAL